MLLQKKHGFELGKGLLLWILHNKSAIQNSAADVCRIATTNRAMVTSPLVEMDRIVDELKKCGLPSPPMKLNQGILNSFLEKHGADLTRMPTGSLNIAEGSGDCKVYEHHSRDGSEGFIEASLYSKATKIYCDLESGVAYNKDYVWPEITDAEKSLHLERDRSPEDTQMLLQKQYHLCII